MRLADIVIERREVTVPGGSIQVRGLSGFDLAILGTTHLKDLFAAYALLQEKMKAKKAIGPGDAEEFISALISSFPALIAAAVALACDEPESEHVVARLPATSLAIILNDIYDLTVFSEFELKKLEAVAVRVIEWATALILKKNQATELSS